MRRTEVLSERRLRELKGIPKVVSQLILLLLTEALLVERSKVYSFGQKQEQVYSFFKAKLASKLLFLQVDLKGVPHYGKLISLRERPDKEVQDAVIKLTSASADLLQSNAKLGLEVGIEFRSLQAYLVYPYLLECDLMRLA